MKANVIDSRVDETSQLYEGCFVHGSKLGQNNVIGNLTRVDKSTLGRNVRIDRLNQVFYSNVGDFTYTGMNTVLMNCEVGPFCSISWSVSIGGPNHDYHRMTQHSFLYNERDKIRPSNVPPAYDRFENKTVIGADVWVGCHAVINSGVSVGHGAVIGANSIVTKDVPAYAIAVGNPAKVVGYRFDKKLIERLLSLEWWTLPEDSIKENFEIISKQPTHQGIDKLEKIKREIND